MERHARTKLHRMDYGILLTVTLLCAFGLVMLFSATYYSAQNRAVTNYDGYYYLRRQVVYMLIAYPVMLLLSSVLLLYFRKKYHRILREGRV